MLNTLLIATILWLDKLIPNFEKNILEKEENGQSLEIFFILC